MNSNRLQARNITKLYAGAVANQDISITIQSGEIHALLGENGAGKSTLMKIIYGLVRPDAGNIDWEGQRVNFNNPMQAKLLGINMVFQHFSLFETLTVTENVALTLPKSKKWNLSQVDRKIRIFSHEYGLNIDPDRPVYTLSVGEKQRVEIIRCLLQATKLLILDEPTAVLAPQESENLFIILRQIAANGCSILFSSHKLNEVRSLCSRATVLRQGRVVGECNPQEEQEATLAQMMVGEEVPQTRIQQQIPGGVCFLVRELSLPPQHQLGTGLKHINLELHSGEIVGIAGIAGNGQQELLAVLSGEIILNTPSTIMLGEMPIANFGVAKRRRYGLGYAPEERLNKGVVPSLNLMENALLTAYGQGLLRRSMIRYNKLKLWTNRICDAFGVKHAGLHVPMANLSGGNVQKFIMGREIQQNPAVLIAAHPSWGVDIKATANIHSSLIEMRRLGTGVLIISEDLDELLMLCDRIGVIYQGRLFNLKPVSNVTRSEIGRLMTGISAR